MSLVNKPLVKKTALRQLGFYIPPKKPFFEDQTAQQIYTALLGLHDDGINDAMAKKRAADTFTSLYRLAVSNKVLFRAPRGSDMIWGAIVANGIMFQDIEVADAKEILRVMSMARNAYVGTVTDLTQLANQ